MVDFLKSVALGILAALAVGTVAVLTSVPFFITVFQVVVGVLATIGGLWALGQIIRDMLG